MYTFAVSKLTTFPLWSVMAGCCTVGPAVAACLALRPVPVHVSHLFPSPHLVHALDSGDLPWGLALARAAREKRAMMENCIFAVESI